MPHDATHASLAPSHDPATEIRGVFEKLSEKHKIPDVLVFREVYEHDRPIRLDTRISPRARVALGRFLRDVTACPPEVLAHARQLLLPREEPPEPAVEPDPAPAIVVTREPAATYMGRVPNHTPHPTIFGSGEDDFQPVFGSST